MNGITATPLQLAQLITDNANDGVITDYDTEIEVATTLRQQHQHIQELEQALKTVAAPGWECDGSLLYRLRDGINCDELEVRMVDGSRDPQLREARALDLHTLLTPGAASDDSVAPAPDTAPCNEQPASENVERTSKHTPGPWRVRALQRNGVITDCFVAANSVQGLPYDAEILGDDEYIDDMDRKVADARLIAAAPDLFDALQAALRVFEGMRVIDLDTSLAMRAAQAAISKAEEGAAC